MGTETVFHRSSRRGSALFIDFWGKQGDRIDWFQWGSRGKLTTCLDSLILTPAVLLYKKEDGR